MARAVWNGLVIAESEEVIEIENSLYFPRESVRMDLLRPSTTNTRCPWKGRATYYSLIDDETVLDDVAWSYENPRTRARVIKDCMAFWKQVTISM
jgi:uncharacterized protein (DUF427 family)